MPALSFLPACHPRNLITFSPISSGGSRVYTIDSFVQIYDIFFDILGIHLDGTKALHCSESIFIRIERSGFAFSVTH